MSCRTTRHQRNDRGQCDGIQYNNVDNKISRTRQNTDSPKERGGVFNDRHEYDSHGVHMYALHSRPHIAAPTRLVLRKAQHHHTIAVRKQDSNVFLETNQRAAHRFRTSLPGKRCSGVSTPPPPLSSQPPNEGAVDFAALPSSAFGACMLALSRRGPARCRSLLVALRLFLGNTDAV